MRAMQSFGEVGDSPRPMMTFRIAGEWLAIPVEQVNRMAQPAILWPVPLSSSQHLGLMDDGGELIPVLELERGPRTKELRGQERLVVIVHVRGEPVGLAIDATGRVYHGFRAGVADTPPPPFLADLGVQSVFSGDGQCWLLDPDRLWQDLQTLESP